MLRRRARGFTLIEVMVALSVVALALASAAISMSQMIGAANTLRDRTYASWIAQNKIAEIRLAGVLPDVDATSGEVDFANSTWAWRAVVSETGVDNLLRVDVTVSRPGEEAFVRQVSGFVGEPVPPGAGSQAWAPSRTRTDVTE
ncbi:MAG: type II secretion system minor pseudopilin GspI [Woeseiaceae bacterium]|nr:type II secretion system minor pseudopilin GspI [Woeseiaceae bacterium]